MPVTLQARRERLLKSVIVQFAPTLRDLFPRHGATRGTKNGDHLSWSDLLLKNLVVFGSAALVVTAILYFFVL
jgi:hypothetical protein